MARHEMDKSSKWMIQHHGNSILRLAGLRGVVRWKALQAELVQPRRLPDGLLEVEFGKGKKPGYFLLEIATHPEKRLAEQVTDDLMLAYQQLRALPDLLTLVLAPKGRLQVDARHKITSQQDWSELKVRWKSVELWKLSASDLLTTEDPGVLPWIPLTQIESPVEDVFVQCRESIERLAPFKEQENLMAVSQVMASLRYTDEEIIALLGGGRRMSEFPLIQKLMAEQMQEDIMMVLKTRFDNVPQSIVSRLRRIRKGERLRKLLENAVVCPDLEVFEERLRS